MGESSGLLNRRLLVRVQCRARGGKGAVKEEVAASCCRAGQRCPLEKDASPSGSIPCRPTIRGRRSRTPICHWYLCDRRRRGGQGSLNPGGTQPFPFCVGHRT